MVSVTDSEEQVLTRKLIVHYDELADVVSECVFLFESFGALSMQEEMADDDVRTGIRLQGNRMTDRLLVLKASLRDVIEQSKRLSQKN